MYYVLTLDGTILDALDHLSCCKFVPRSRAVLRCKRTDDPQGVISERTGMFYHVEGWTEFPVAVISSGGTVVLEEIDKETYDAVTEALDSGEPYTPPQEEEEIPDDATLEFVREAKINAMSTACQLAITGGFSIDDDDGGMHHFSLQITDQIMIAQLALKAQAGAEQLPWHADGEPCRFYTAAEIIAINEQMEALITYHQTYFNSLKRWILAMTTIPEIASVQYGVGIPEEYQSDVLKQLLRGAV